MWSRGHIFRSRALRFCFNNFQFKMENKIADINSNPIEDVKKKSDDVTYKIDFGVVMKEIGDLGKYQILLVLMAYWVTIPSGINQVASVFLAASPSYR